MRNGCLQQKLPKPSLLNFSAARNTIFYRKRVIVKVNKSGGSIFFITEFFKNKGKYNTGN